MHGLSNYISFIILLIIITLSATMISKEIIEQESIAQKIVSQEKYIRQYPLVVVYRDNNGYLINIVSNIPVIDIFLYNDSMNNIGYEIVENISKNNYYICILYTEDKPMRIIVVTRGDIYVFS